MSPINPTAASQVAVNAFQDTEAGPPKLTLNQQSGLTNAVGSSQTAPSSNPEPIHKRLDPTRREIRLIRILRGSEHGPIECRFHTISLDDDDIEFVALSYVWGDANITKQLLVNGHSRAVTKNLESALRNFWTTFWTNFQQVKEKISNLSQRTPSESSLVEHEVLKAVVDEYEQNLNQQEDGRLNDRTSIVDLLRVGCGDLSIWVDALCINQGDMSEKGHQVKMMCDIYSKATRVFSWLGRPDQKNIDLALSTIRKLAPRLESATDFKWMISFPELCAADGSGPSAESLPNKYWNAILSFQSSEYFRRIWIIQELSVSKNIVFICGDQCLDLLHLWIYHYWAAQSRDTLEEISAEVDETLYYRLKPLFPSFYRLFRTLMVTRETFGEKVPSEKLCTFLRTMQRCHCTDPRDKIFGLLGLFPMAVIPDYNMTVKEVYAAWATNPSWEIPLGSLLKFSGVGLYPTDQTNIELPSWLPNLQIINKKILCNTLFEEADGDTDARVSRWFRPKVPLCFRPKASIATGMTFFGLPITGLRDFGTRALKTSSGDIRLGGHQLQCPNPNEINRNAPRLLLPILKYLVANRIRLFNDIYSDGNLWIWALLKTILRIVSYKTYGDENLENAIIAFPLQLVFRAFIASIYGLRYNIMVDHSEVLDKHELGSMGFSSEDEMWDCLWSLPTDNKDGTLKHDAKPDPGMEGMLKQEFTDILTFAIEFSLFHTVNGLIGFGPPGLEDTDQLYLIHGSTWPVALREVGGKMVNVGLCYVHGMSDADAVKILTNKESEVREIHIV